MFDWDEANIDHIALHDVEPEEAEAALTDPRRIPGPVQRGPEPRKAVIGATNGGRVLFVVYTVRQGRARVVTAREAVTWQLTRYKERGK